MKVKLGFFYDAWKAIQDWITGASADKPKVEVDGTVEVSNLPQTQQVAGEVQVTNLPEVQQVTVTEPLPVSINENNATIKSAPVTGAKTITSTAAEVFAGASRLANRYQMTIQNTGTLIIYIGAAEVTVENGFPLLPGDSITLAFKPDVATPIYAISTGSNTVRVVELA